MLKKIKDKLFGKLRKKTKTKAKEAEPSPKKKRSKKRKSVKRDSKKHAIKQSGKVVDPDAKSEAKRYDNPVASRALLLKTIQKKGMMTEKSVYQVLHVTSDQQEGVRRRLNAMVRDGQLVRNRRGGFLPVDEKHFIKGRVIAHAEGYGFLDQGSCYCSC
jgi:ribonuclease R